MINIYNYKYINNIDEFKKIYNDEKSKDNIKKIYYQVYYNMDEMESFHDFSECFKYIKNDYDNYKDDFNLELNNYKISLLLYTKPIDNKGVTYVYDYDINFGDILI